MALSHTTLMEWSHAALEWYRSESKNYIPVPELDRRDVELAGDVATLMPMLYLLVRNYVGMRQNPTFIEIGTADGSSALPVLKAAAELGGHLHCVDIGPCPDAHRLVDRFGYRKYFTHHQMPSDEFFKTFDKPIDFAFIDGDHRWPIVKRDISNCYKLLNQNCMIWTSDYNLLHEGQITNYEHQYRETYAEHIGSESGHDTLDEQQGQHGIAKAVYNLLPTLKKATAVFLPIYPNPSILIRKMYDAELDPLKLNIF